MCSDIIAQMYVQCLKNVSNVLMCWVFLESYTGIAIKKNPEKTN